MITVRVVTRKYFLEHPKHISQQLIKNVKHFTSPKWMFKFVVDVIITNSLTKKIG